MRSQPQRFSTRTQDWMSHDVKRRPDARYLRWCVRKQAQICYYPTEAPFHSDQRCSHIADAADEHSYGWVSSEVRQPARNLHNAQRCATLRLILDRWMRSILPHIAIVDPDANLSVLDPTPSFKHLSRGPLFHSFLSQPKPPFPAQPAPVLPLDRGKTGGVLVLVLGSAPQAQDFV